MPFCRDQKKTRGKIRLTNMLKSGKELKVFAVRDGELRKFCEEAKKYGVLYCVLKDNNAADGLTDIMVRAEDAGKINRIFERFGLATVDMASVKTEIQQSREDNAKGGDDISTPERSQTADDKLNQFLEAVAAEQPDPTAEPTENTNPTTARTAKSVRPSVPPGAETPTAAGTALSEITVPLCGKNCGKSAASRDRSCRRPTERICASPFVLRKRIRRQYCDGRRQGSRGAGQL